MIRHFAALLRHDASEGILKRWKYYALSALFFCFVSFVFNRNNKAAGPGFIDYFINAFLGNEPFQQGGHTGIKISMIWFVFHASLLAMVGFYIVNDLRKSATSYILRVKSRNLWWAGKYVWCLLTVLVYYCLFFVICLLFSACNFSLHVNSQIALNYFHLNASHIGAPDLFLTVCILPMLISMAMCIFEIALGLIIRPVFSYIFIIVILIASAYYRNIFLIGNYTMVIRSDFFSHPQGITYQNGILLSLILMAFSYFLGRYAIAKKSIL